MLNKLFIIVLILSFSITACDKERDNVTETGIPDSVELIKSTLSGKITDNNEIPIANAVVKVMYENFELGRTTTNAEGRFELKEQAVQKDKTYLVFEKEGFSPNIFNSLFEENGQIDLHPVLKALSVDQLLSSSASDLNLTNQIKVGLPSNLVIGNNPKVRLQFLDLERETKNNMLAVLATDGVLQPSKVIWIDILNDQNQSLTWKEDAEVTFYLSEELKKEFSNTIWYFDPVLGRWTKNNQLTNTDGQTYFKIKKAGYYASVNPCLLDIEKPVPYCKNNVEVTYTPGNNLLYATTFDAGSYDNCDTNLDLKIKRISDSCGNGDNVFKPYISLCASDEGQTFPVVIKVTDDSNNSDSVVVNLIVAGSNPCPNDNKKPIPYCKTNVDVFYAANGGEVPANFFDAGSYDDCSSSSELKFLIKKVQPDTCNNGSNLLSEFLKLCPAEIGKTLDVEIHLYDQNNNTDFCSIRINIKP
ncbi:MAG: carboxypeptidase regulatory-like domain-containing protein [Saprospiraceae bacterium]|nr:carboxypeptidase regulatory-like domain-containing protein [Saprospiraceae bacterium]